MTTTALKQGLEKFAIVVSDDCLGPPHDLTVQSINLVPRQRTLAL